MSDRAGQRPQQGAKRSSGPRDSRPSARGGGENRNQDRSRGGGRHGGSGAAGNKRDSNTENGIIVTVKEGFGFVRSFTRTEDLFFHFDELERREDAVVGQEISFSARISNKTGRETGVNIKTLKHGSFLEQTGDYSNLPTIGPATLEKGEIIYLGEKSGAFLTNSKQLSVFDLDLVSDRSFLKKGAELACKVVRDSSSKICVAVPPFKPPKSALELGLVRILERSDQSLSGKIRLEKDGVEVSFNQSSMSKSTPEIRDGDYVWFSFGGSSANLQASDMVLCTPKGETPFFQTSQTKNGPEILNQWLGEEASASDSGKRLCGTVSAVRDSFAFIKPDRPGENLFMPLSELCLSHPEFVRSGIQPGEFVTFEVRKVDTGKNDIAARVFSLPGLSKAVWKRGKDVLIASGLQGKVGNANPRSVKTIEYDVWSLSTAESPELWNLLKEVKAGDEKSLSLKSAREESLAVQYCKWLGLEFDAETSRVIGKQSQKLKPAIVPCQAQEQADEHSEITYDVGDPVVFDLFFDTNTQRRFAMVVPQVLPSRSVNLKEGEKEIGVIASLNPPVIYSIRREAKLKPATALSGKVGDMVTFVAESQRYGTVLRATNVEPSERALDKPELVGLVPLSNVRLRGVVSREAPKASPSDTPSIVSLLQSSYSNGPRSGTIAIGRDDEILQQLTKANAAKETEAKGSTDWRKENELLRAVRACKDRIEEVEEDPLQILKVTGEAERRSVEKEAKRQGLFTRFLESTNEICIARSKSSAATWASKVGKTVRIEPFGEGVVMDVKVRDDAGTVLHVGLYPDGNGGFGAHLYCLQNGPSAIHFIEQERSKDRSDGNEAESLSDMAISAVRAWVHQGISPPQALATPSTTHIVLPDAPAWVDACVAVGIYYERDLATGTLHAYCDTEADIEQTALSKFVGNFAFALDHNQGLGYVPIEGDVVEFTPCRSIATGVLRAAHVTLVTAAPGRTTGEVEELSNKGGWVRPKGKLAAEYLAIDVVNGRSLEVGNIVDFYLSEKGDRATKVRFLQNNPKRTTSPANPPVAGNAEVSRPRINQQLINNAPNLSSAAASNQAPGPDGTIGFTREKWRNKRLQETALDANASDFTPASLLSTVAQVPLEATLQATANAVPAATAKPATAKPVSTKISKKKIRADAPEFVPGGAAKQAASPTGGETSAAPNAPSPSPGPNEQS